MHRVAIIRSIVLKYGRAGSVARLSESASCLPESTLMVKPCCLAKVGGRRGRMAAPHAFIKIDPKRFPTFSETS